MKKALALLALTLLALPSSALSLQRIVPLYQIGDGAIQTNDGRIVANPMTDDGYGYVYAAGISSQVPTNCTIKGIVPSGQKISSWWVYPQDPRYRASEGMKISGSDYRGTVIYDDTNYDLSNATVEQYLRYLVARGIDLGTDYIGEYIYNGTHYNDGYCSGESLIQAYIRKYHAFNVFAVRDRLLERGIKLSVLDALAGFGWTYASAYPNVIYAVLKSDYIRYNLAFNPAGGTGDMATLQGNVYTNGFALPPNSFGRTGYTFVGWTNSVGTAFADGASVSGAALGVLTDGETATLSAKWAANVYTVKFDAKGGSVSPTSANATYGAAYGELPTPVRTGYKFAGWYNAGNAITATTVCQKTGAHTLFAKWTANAYTVKFDSKGGNVSPTSQRVTYGGTYGTLPIPVREGYAFAGWYNAGDEITATTVCRKTGAHTLFAKWTVNTYTVAFGANGGSGAMDRQTFTYGRAQALAANAFARTGYTFGGWATTTSGTAVYANKAVVSNLTATAGGVCALYATWTANTYKVYFNANDGSVSPATQHVTYDAAYGTLPTPVREGYVFAGWYNAGNVMTATTICRKTGAHTLFAKWTANAYTVKFDANGGSVSPASQRVAYGGTYGTLPTPTRTGYTFAGWYNAGNVITATTICQKTGAHKLFAKWTANAYTVAFDGNGGTGAMPPQALVYDAPANLAANAFARAGYAFAGWNRSVNGSGAAYADGAVVSNLTTVANGTVPLYAQWTANAYTVKFDANGGATPTASKQVTYGGTYGTLPTPTRPGYAFAGWYNAGNVITATTICQKAGSHKLFAKWAANAYTVRFARNGGTGGSMEAQGFVYDVAQPLAANAFTRIGYGFTGWATNATDALAYLDEAVVSNLTAAANGAVTLYARWAANAYTVAFGANGGAGEMPPQELVYDAPTNLAANAFTRTGYAFAGWATTPGGSKAYDDGASVVNLTAGAGETVTLHARWTANAYTVNFDANGSTTATASKQVTYGGTYGTLPTPTRPGYAFAGWHTADGEQVTGATEVTAASDQTLHARWAANAYTVAFGANGGAGEMPPQELVYDAPTNLAANAFTRTGYAFAGWNRSANGSGAAYLDEAVVSNLTTTANGTVPLYAQWTANTYTVTLDRQSGSGGTSSVTATYNAAMPTITKPTRTGYTFGGYYDQANGGGTQYYTAAGASARNWNKTAATTLYAKWTANTYTVTLDRQSGSGGTSSVTATYNAAMPTITVPTRTGYTFGGYYDQANGGGTQYYTAAGASAGNWNKTAAITLYAKWTANTYSVHFNANGGSGTMASQSFTYDVAQALAANAYARDGYVFSGWTNSTGTAYADVASVSNLASANGAVVDLYAKWTHLWTVVFMDDALFDSEVISSNAYPNGTSIVQPSAPSHTGYTFKGWAPSVSQTAVADATYVAQYEANKYRVTFHSNYGDDVTNGTMRFTYGESFSIPASISGLTSREGYVLEGWGTTADAETPQYAPAATGVLFEDASAVNLYAVWKPIAYTIAFDGDGAEAGSVDDIAAVYDRAYALPANGFARSGFNFTGWRFGNATYAVGASVSNLTTTADGTVTFYAVWSELRYAAFDGHGADNAEAMIDDVLTFDGVETKSLVSNKFEKTGYTFVGWATNETEAASLNDSYADGADVVSTNLWGGIGETNIFYAVWQTNTYTVVFNANGGTGEMAPQAFVYDQAQALSTCTFESSLGFAGWATNETDEIVFTDRDEVSNLTAEADGTVTLFAVWNNGELSKAMHCPNLYWEQTNQSGTEAWRVVAGGDEGYDPIGAGPSGSSVSNQVSRLGNHFRTYMLYPAQTSSGAGKLSFWYRMSVAAGCSLTVEHQDATSTNLPLSKVWRQFGPVNVPNIENLRIYFKLNGDYQGTEKDFTVWIDQMTWVPAGAEPTEEDTPTISSFSAKSTGGFLLSIAASSPTFVYTVLTNATLTADESEWGVYKSVDGTGEPMDFDLATEADAPGVFYKVRVDSK